jgi:hypothetical protein
MTATIEHGTNRGLRPDGGPARSVPVVVIGAGQAGLSAAIALSKLVAPASGGTASRSLA